MPDSFPRSDAATDCPPRRKGLLRRLYDWTIHWAATPYALLALVLISLAGSIFFPIPPDVLLIAIVVADPRLWWRTAAWCTLASVIGGLTGYAIGHFAWEGVADFFFTWIPGFTPDAFAKFQSWYDAWGVVVVLIAGFSPIPYEVFAIASGVAGMPIVSFTLASIVGRGGRFFLVAGLLRLFGPPVRRFIEKYFDLLALLFVVLLGGGFALLGLLK